jgi:hypothetical protein
MADKSEKKEYRNRESFIQDAINLERRAETLRREGKDVTADDIGLMYIDAGVLRERAADYLHAKDDYLNAKIYGFPHHSEIISEIDKRIKLLDDRRNLSSFLKSIKEKREKENKGKNLGSRFYSILSIGFLASALFFVSSSLTGNVIAGLNYNNSRFVGICFFACGLIFAFLYSRCRMKKKNAASKTKNKKRKK